MLLRGMQLVIPCLRTDSGIDLTARNIQEEAKKAGLPWTAAKGTVNSMELTIGYNSFLPLSEFIPKEKIPDPHNVRLQLQVNGNVVQDDNTNLMLHKIPDLFEAITDVMDLNRGDIILSKLSEFARADYLAGTPKGVGQVVNGDVMKASCFVGDDLIESFEVSCVDRKRADGTQW